jgi:hypothetical protein
MKGGLEMADNKEKQLKVEETVELNDLSQEVSEKQLRDVQGGDLQVSSKPIIVKKPVRP